MYDQFADFDGHALVTTRQDHPSGLSAIIALHNEHRGPAMGGCRILKYPSTDAAMKDVLRLSRGMTYKNAIAGIPYGGGKAVIIADPTMKKNVGLLHAMGDFVESLGGRYITSFDSGTSLDYVRTIGERTNFVAGTLAEAGDASGTTANGVYHCMRAAAEIVFGSPDLCGMRIAIQGVGNVGRRLAEQLARDGASLIIADLDPEAARRVAGQTGAELSAVEDLLGVEADIISPCALGGILTAQSIAGLKARIVVGGANNQLATIEDDTRLLAAGILYCPDYIANAGGIIDLHYQRSAWSAEAVERHVLGLADTFREVAERSRTTGRGTAAIANVLAEERFRPAARRTA
ncbi:MAG: Glu/Leu/Phe/Val dehydrogenase dimerization domain-containing protein [Pseudomonadota bacterium]